MANSNNKELISRASPHTIKKFELIEEYIKAWAQKLMLNNYCDGIIFIDCMSNSGLYYDENNELVAGTPIRVARVLSEVAYQYPEKNVFLYFNDIDQGKTDLLQRQLPVSRGNFTIEVTHEDGNALLKEKGSKLNSRNHLNYFLLYDPYDASIDWEALFPFFRNWGEVMINHMVSDPVRAIRMVKRTSTRMKYENTYLEAFEDLVPYGSNKDAYEERVEEIIDKLKGRRDYYVAAFPFYNSRNSQVYSLIHCTSNIEGFKLYKKSAWKTFGGQSSTKKTCVVRNQLAIDLSGQANITITSDETCFVVMDIAKYLSRAFAGRNDVPLQELWDLLDMHPIFPSDGYRREIRHDLETVFGAKSRQSVNPWTGKREIVISFLKGNSPI